MRIKSITIRGFRGFNREQTIECDKRLTVLYAPNSYGKTSISEAVEWLLYGVTSKVREADSKEEYKGSYVNRHYAGPGNPFVSLLVDDDGTDVEFKAELLSGDTQQRYVNGEKVETWPFDRSLTAVPGPFVLQHALKNLLLATPDRRFMGFARVLGLEALDQIQKDVVSLCTKPQVHTPTEVQQVLNEAAALQARAGKYPALAPINRALGKGLSGLSTAYALISSECTKRVPPGTAEDAVLPSLLQIREEAVGRVFKGSVALESYSPEELTANEGDERHISSFWGEEFVQDYLSLVALRTVGQLLDRARFYNLGMELWSKNPEVCPFCGQGIGADLSTRIGQCHQELTQASANHNALGEKCQKMIAAILGLKDRLNAYHRRHVEKATALLGVDLEKLEGVLTQKYGGQLEAVRTAVSDLAQARHALISATLPVKEALDAILKSLRESTEDPSVIKALGDALITYVSGARAYDKTLGSHILPTTDAARVVKHELDAIAGTEEISVLIDLMQHRRTIRAKLEVDAVLDDLKDLRKQVDQLVGNKVLEAISGTLTGEVMGWYDLIKTDGDPDIHFGGFDMERTVKGELRARRVQVKAKSYGAELVSAVSSLSESKLNALGLCISIAANLRHGGPFQFLMIDDPIQSLDAEHETRFIDLVRKLVEDHERQVVLLSHNQAWLRQLKQSCRTLNGWYYEIRGYTVNGPVVANAPWSSNQHRLQEVAAIIEDQTASSIRLQQAEEEIRILVGEVTAELYAKVKRIQKSPHTLNSAKVRKMLVECGVKPALVDRIDSTFVTTDDAHHAPSDYAAQRQRIAAYRSWVQELMTYLK